MIEKSDQKVWFISSARRALDADAASDEPSHIHIPRPSRAPRRGTPRSSVDPTDEARDLAAAEVVVQAA
jgi:hypothetical protein